MRGAMMVAATLTPQEWRGFSLFDSKGCASCRSIGPDAGLYYW